MDARLVIALLISLHSLLLHAAVRPSGGLESFGSLQSQILQAREARNLANLQRAHELVLSGQGRMSMRHYYQLTMELCYAYMQFGDYQQAGVMVAAELANLQRWQPDLAGIEVKANLMHIYGQYLTRQSRTAEAIGYYLDAEAMFKRVDPEHPSLFAIQVILGEAFLASGLYQRAVSSLEQALLLKPPARVDGVSYLVGKQARAYLGLGQITQARTVLDAYMLNPVDPRSDYYLYFQLANAQVLLAEGDYQSVIGLATVLLPAVADQRDTRLIGDWYGIAGQAWLATGDLERAEMMLQQALTTYVDSISIESTSIHQALVQIFQLQGRLQEALTASQALNQGERQLMDLTNNVRIAELVALRSLKEVEQANTLAQTQVSLLETRNRQAELRFWLTATTTLILVMLVAFLVLQWRRTLQRNRLLAQFGYEDYLTGLGNRRAFHQALANSLGMQLAIIDLDGLKQVNDQRGHDVGDAMITRFARTLRSHLSSLGGKAYRIGGDEFAMLIDSAHNIDALIEQVVMRVRLQGFPEMAASYGYTVFDGRTSDCMSVADAAMYQMKSNRKLARNV